MNKRAISSGVTWFFAIIVLFIILLLFYVASSFLFLSAKKPQSTTPGTNSFTELNSLRQTYFMADYFHEGVYNNFSYTIYKTNSINGNDVFSKLISLLLEKAYFVDNLRLKKDNLCLKMVLGKSLLINTQGTATTEDLTVSSSMNDLTSIFPWGKPTLFLNQRSGLIEYGFYFGGCDE